MNTCEILFIVGYLLICFTAFAGHLITLFAKIKKGDTWQDTSRVFGGTYKYKFSFYENILGWGFASLIPVFNIGMIIYDVVYLTNPLVKKLDEIVNNLFGAEGND